MEHLFWIVLVIVGALILCPAVALVGLDPWPGDFTITWGTNHYYMPFPASLIVSSGLTLLFLMLRR